MTPEPTPNLDLSVNSPSHNTSGEADGASCGQVQSLCAWPDCGCSDTTNCFTEIGGNAHVVRTVVVGIPPESEPIGRGRTTLTPPSDFMTQYDSFTDSLSMSYRRQAESLGFVVNPRKVPASEPCKTLHHRCYELTRPDSHFRRLVLEADMFTFLETWADALAHVRETSMWWEAP